jgi:hypothetical protein
VDIMVEKETGDAVAGFAEFPERVEGARSAADVEEKIHGWNYEPNMADRSSGEWLLPVTVTVGFRYTANAASIYGCLPAEIAQGLGVVLYMPLCPLIKKAAPPFMGSGFRYLCCGLSGKEQLF